MLIRNRIILLGQLSGKGVYFMKKFKLILFLVLLGFCLSGMALASGHPFSKNTEVYYELNLSYENIENVLWDGYNKLKEIEPLQPYLRKIDKDLEMDLGKDVLSWIGNKVEFGVLGVGYKPTLHREITEYLRYKRSVEELQRTVFYIKNIVDVIEDEKEDKGILPSNLKEILPKDMLPPRGGRFIYKRLGKDHYIVTVPANQFTDLGLKGNAPIYDNKKGFSKDEPVLEKSFKLKNWLLAVKVKDSDKARAFFKKLENVSGLKFKKRAYGLNLIRVSPQFSYTFKGSYLLVSDNEKVLLESIRALNREDKSIKASPIYSSFRSRLKGKVDELLFVDFNKVKVAPSLLKIKDRNVSAFVKNLNYLGYATVSLPNGDISSDVFVTFKNASSIPILKRYISTKPYDPCLIGRLPANLPIAVTYNIGEAWNIMEAIGKEEEKYGAKFKMLETIVSKVLNIDFEEDFLNKTTGEIGVTYKPRDVLLSVIIEAIKGVKSGKIDIDKKSRKVSGMIKAENLPLTFLVMAKSSKDAQFLVNRVVRNKKSFRRFYYKDIPIYRGTDGCYCVVDNLIIYHTTPYTGILRKYVDYLKTPENRLADKKYFNEFSKEISGRVLVLQYNDIRWAGYLSKGLILFLLPEFSNYTECLDKYQCSWMYFSISSKEFRIHTHIFKK